MITDQLRAGTFILAEGVVSGNDGRTFQSVSCANALRLQLPKLLPLFCPAVMAMLVRPV
ncbi:MAG: hypothetical protein JKY56_14130 [Kofleriaceae bacterium]|nr:hypothetical protein [Kofleriaceae bacterium]